MAGKLKDDEIKWILSLDAKGVQSELVNISSKADDLKQKNKILEAHLTSATARMRDAQKEMDKLKKSGNEYSEAFQEQSRLMHAASNMIQKYTDEIKENKKEIEKNELLANEVIKRMKIEEMTMAQLIKRANDLGKQLLHTSEAADPKVYKQLEDELSKVKVRMGELKTASQSTLSVLKGGLMVAAGNLLTQGVGKIKELVSEAKEWVKEGMNMAKGAISIEDAFKGLSNSTRIMREMKAASSDTINELDLMQKAVKANELGIPIENMGKLLDYARRQAAKLGTDVDYMANSIVDGIGRKSTLILDNLGISATRVQSEVKKTGDFTQAVMKIVNDELQKQGSYAETAADKAAQASVKWENAQLAVGKKFMWLGGLWDTISSGIADDILMLVGETETLTKKYDNQINKVADLEYNSEKMANRYDELKSKTSLNKDEQTELNTIMNTLANTIPGVVAEMDQYGNILSINTSKVYDFIRAEKARLKVMNADAIKEQEDALEKLYRRRDILIKETTTGRESKVSRGGITYESKLSDEEMLERKKNLDEIKDQILGHETELNRISGKTLEEQTDHQVHYLKQQSEFNAMNKKQLDEWIKDEKNASSDYLALAQQTYKQRFGGEGSEGTKSKGAKSDPELQRQKKLLNKLNEDLEITHKEKLAKINLDYLSGKIKTEADYKRKEFSQQQAYYLLQDQALKDFIEKSKNEEIKRDASKELATVHEKMLAQQIKYQKELEKIILDANPIEKEKRAYDERLDAIGLFGVGRENMTADQLAALELLEKQHQENLRNIKRAGAAQAKKDAETRFNEGTDDEPGFNKRKEELQIELNELMKQAAANPTFDAEMAVHMKRLQMITEETEARKAAGLETTKQMEQQGRIEANMTTTINKELQKRMTQIQQYTASFGQAMGNVITGQEDLLKAFGDSTIDIVFDVLSKIIEAELIKVMATSTSAIMRATAESMATPQSALSFGAAGFATAAVLTGAITAATMVAKTALKGLIGGKKSKGSSSSSDNAKSSGSMSVKKRGYADGGFHEGYTGDGTKYDVKGYFSDGQPYHAGEYIIPKEELKLPWVENMVRQIDSTRLRRTSKNPLPEGFADGGYHGDEFRSSYPGLGMDPGLMKRFIEVMDRFDKKEFKTYLGITEYQAKLEEKNKEENLFTNK